MVEIESREQTREEIILEGLNEAQRGAVLHGDGLGVIEARGAAMSWTTASEPIPCPSVFSLVVMATGFMPAIAAFACSMSTV